MAQLKTVIQIDVNGVDEAIRKTRSATNAVEDFTKKLQKADFSVVSDLEKRLRSADFSLGTKGTDGITAVSNGLKLTRQEALALTYTFNDVAASLATGASPFTILLQQGGQVTQAFGGIRNTISTLLPFVLRLSPAFLAAAGAAVAFFGLKAADNAAKAISDISKQADAARVSFERFQTLVSAGAAVGADQNEIASGLERIAQAARNAVNEQDKYTEKLNKLQFAVGNGIEGADKELATLYEQRPDNIFDKLQISIAGFQTGTKDAFDIVKQLIDKLSRKTGFDRTNFLAEVESAFGGGIADIVKSDPAAVDKFVATLNKLAPPLKKADAEAAKAQRTLSTLLDLANARIDTQIGAAFLPASIELKKLLVTTFSDNLPIIRAFAAQVAEVFRVINGNKAAQARNPVLTEFVGVLREIKGIAGDAAGALGSLFNGLRGAFGELYKYADDIVVLFNDLFGTNFETSKVIAVGALSAIAAAFGPIGIGIGLAIAALIALKRYWPEISEAGRSAANIILDAWNAVSTAFEGVWTPIRDAAIAAWQEIVNTVYAAFQTISSALGSISFAGVWDGFKVSAEQAFNAIYQLAVDIFNRIRNAAANTLSSIGNAISQAGSSIAGSLGFASGGYVSGPGTGTSDSIPARLSNGEFVVRAAAVRRFGVDFFRRLNGMSLNPSALATPYRFADGGLVGVPSASVSSSAGRSFNLVIDGRMFGGLSGNNDTISALEKYASLRQLSATSKRAPSRIG